MSLIYGPLFNDEYSMSFDGTDDYISGGPAPDFDGITKFGFSVWFKTNTTTAQQPIFWRGITADIVAFFSPLSSNTIWLSIKSGHWVRSTATINVGIWYHLAVFVDYSLVGTDRIRMFFDGVDITGTMQIGGGPQSFPVSTEPLLIGVGNYSALSYFDGLMDELAFWLDIDPRAEINNIYNNGRPGRLNFLNTPPTMWYRMGDNAVFKDPQWLLPENSNKDKVSNYSMDFDGTDDYVDCGDVLHNDGQTPMTVSAWVKITTAAGHTNSAPVANKKKVRMGPTYIMNGWAVNFLTSGAQTNRLHFELVGDGTIATGTLSKKALTLSFTDGLWHNVVVTYDGSESAAGVKFYIDGTEDTNTQTLQDTFSGTLPNDPTVDFQIGKVPKYGGTNYMDGNIANVHISTQALSANEVLHNYNALKSRFE
jgi:hypothetical protein